MRVGVVVVAAVLVAARFADARPPRPDVQPVEGDKIEVAVTPGVTDGSAFAYHDYDGLTGFVQGLAGWCANITSVFSIGRSVQGRELWVVRVTDNPTAQEDEPEVLLVGNMHGDETVGREILVHWIHEICTQYLANDPYTVALVDNTDLYVLVSMNPDGFELQQRANARAVDLNRNFPDQFGSSQSTRQPETAHAMAFLSDRRFSLGANMHGGTVVCNYPWDVKKSRRSYSYAPDDSLLIHLCLAFVEPTNMAEVAADEFTLGITNGAEWYIVHGGLQDYSYATHGMLHVTLELSYTKFVEESELEDEWNEYRPALYRYAEQVHRGVRGFVFCDCVPGRLSPGMGSGERVTIPVAASLVFSGGEPSDVEGPPAMQRMTTRTDPAIGDFHRVLLPGEYEVTVVAHGCGDPITTVVVVPEPSGTEGIELITGSSVQHNFTFVGNVCPGTHRSGNMLLVLFALFVPVASVVVVVFLRCQHQRRPRPAHNDGSCASVELGLIGNTRQSSEADSIAEGEGEGEMEGREGGRGANSRGKRVRWSSPRVVTSVVASPRREDDRQRLVGNADVA